MLILVRETSTHAQKNISEMDQGKKGGLSLTKDNKERESFIKINI